MYMYTYDKCIRSGVRVMGTITVRCRCDHNDGGDDEKKKK